MQSFMIFRKWVCNIGMLFSFQEHIKSNLPQKVLSVDEFLTLRAEVRQVLRQYETPVVADDAPPGDDCPPGEEPEDAGVVSS